MTEETKPANENAAAKKQPEPSKNPESKKAAASKQKPSGFFRALKIMLLLCLITVISVGCWLGWAYWQAQIVSGDNSQQQLASLQDSVDSMQQQFKLDQKRQSLQLQNIKQLQQTISNLQLRSNSHGQRLAELGSTSRSDWLIAEAVYLTRLANQRLQTERSIKNPLALLASVDVILQELDDPELTPARSALAADITALRLAGEVDAEGIFLELSSVVNSIGQLSMRSTPTEPEESSRLPPGPLVETQSENSDSAIAEFAKKLSKLIRVQRRSQPIEPMLQPEEEVIVRQNLRLMLEQAQSGLLREQQVIYSQSISKAQSWLMLYFQLNPSAQVISERLAELAKVQVVQQLPQINSSLNAIETVVAMRRNRLSEGTQQELQR
ncbi:MAG: uroporphyrinogen-III C-methyltransferase [Porticoccaceae bacterium]|nr:uroporphyrinogen-III C-methyltransferase [Porticoccaceae bacterium]